MIIFPCLNKCKTIKKGAKVSCPLFEKQSCHKKNSAHFTHIHHPKVIEDIFQHHLLIFIQISFGFFIQHAQNINGLLCQRKIFFFDTGRWIFDNTQLNQNRGVERKNKCLEINFGKARFLLSAFFLFFWCFPSLRFFGFGFSLLQFGFRAFYFFLCPGFIFPRLPGLRRKPPTVLYHKCFFLFRHNPSPSSASPF